MFCYRDAPGNEALRTVVDIVSFSLSSAEVGGCLHCLMSDDSGSVQACLAYCASGDSLVLMNTAVNLLLSPDWKLVLETDVAVYVLAEDSVARGISPDSSDCKFIDDAAWVKLFKRHPHCLSWK